jgi:hypothetical protein
MKKMGRIKILDLFIEFFTSIVQFIVNLKFNNRQPKNSCFDETALRSLSGISVQQNAGRSLCPPKVDRRGRDAAMEDRLSEDGEK